MTFIDQYKAKGLSPASTEFSYAEMVQDWSALPAAPAGFSRANPYSLARRDGLAGGSVVRIRPHDQYGSYADFDGKLASAKGYQLANHVGTLTSGNVSAVKISAFDNSSAALRRTVTTAAGTIIEYATYSCMEVANCEVFNVWRTNGSTAHTDGIWLSGGASSARRSSFWIHDTFIHHCGGSCSTILIEQAWYDVGIIDRFIASDNRNLAFIKGNGRLLVIANSPGFRCSIDGKWDKVIIFNCPGASIANPAGNVIERPTGYTVPTFDSNGKLVVTNAPPTPPTPTIDYKALAEQLKSQLVTVQADLDTRLADLAKLRSWSDQIYGRAAAVSLATGQLMETIKQRPA
jgi:hypothetical protein